MCIDLERLARTLAIAAVTLLPLAAHAHGPAHDKPAGAQPVLETGFGRTGDARKTSRTIRLEMSDAMRFTPAAIEVKRGETVRFVVTNAGKVMHEMVLGTMQDLKAHAELMEKHPGMEHDEPYMAHVAPGKKGEIVWTFNRTGEFDFACLLPGHFDAGMKGTVRVAAR
jgi:uncharacterized cupredoxin-like copper-binding protein